MCEMKNIKDVKFVPCDKYIITAYSRDEVIIQGGVKEWRCLEVSPKGAVKIKNLISKDVQWLLPTDRVEIFDHIPNVG